MRSRLVTMYFDYNVLIATSYEMSALIDKLFGDSIKDFEEIRDGGGYLKQFRVVALMEIPNV